jgi:release factor glutamine methyltransferase
MAQIVKYITGRIYRPILAKYLSSTRIYRYQGLRLQIPAAVFHPGFFFSTKLLLRFIARKPLQGRSFLELGAGSGLISLFAAQKGAVVTASDINLVAVTYLRTNSTWNDLPVTVIHSDLFERIQAQKFDIIAINPPFYNRQPRTDAEYAWYCGENGEYFSGLFSGLKPYTNSGTAIWMILSDACDLGLIRRLAQQSGWGMECVWTGKNWLERNYIFSLHPL